MAHETSSPLDRVYHKRAGFLLLARILLPINIPGLVEDVLHNQLAEIKSHKRRSSTGVAVRMAVSKLVLVCACALALAAMHVGHAQNSPQDYLSAHNVARAQVGVGPMVWDNAIAAYAQNYASRLSGDCRMVHSGGPYGENLFWGGGDMFTAGDAVRLWVSEKQYYDYNSNSCAIGRVCGHYTQVVWRNSVRLGCARVRCNNGGVIISCNYSPPGNYVGQRPY
ncbi:hypothetical protein Taro_010008 [Colocasia esculenta]|uniref:SCP domain-containing protein n=1 Tax=Colocasia esculenta TaxID=4460 RepID=A0A843U2H4_COLES|nr:hypothetical protein [Colocasia esculenta]